MNEKVSSDVQKVSGEKQWKEEEKSNGSMVTASLTGISKWAHSTADWEEGSIGELGDRTVKTS